MELNNLIIENQNMIYKITHYFEKYASKEDLWDALCHYVTFENKEEVLSWQDFIDLGLVGNKALRFQVCESFHIGPCNAKTCFKRLNQMNVTKEEIEERSLS